MEYADREGLTGMQCARGPVCEGYCSMRQRKRLRDSVAIDWMGDWNRKGT